VIEEPSATGEPSEAWERGMPRRVGEARYATLGVDERLVRLAALVVPARGDFCTSARPAALLVPAVGP
jgi:hypothetical protein